MSVDIYKVEDLTSFVKARGSRVPEGIFEVDLIGSKFWFPRRMNTDVANFFKGELGNDMVPLVRPKGDDTYVFEGVIGRHVHDKIVFVQDFSFTGTYEELDVFVGASASHEIHGGGVGLHNLHVFQNPSMTYKPPRFYMIARYDIVNSDVKPADKGVQESVSFSDEDIAYYMKQCHRIMYVDLVKGVGYKASNLVESLDNFGRFYFRNDLDKLDFVEAHKKIYRAYNFLNIFIHNTYDFIESQDGMTSTGNGVESGMVVSTAPTTQEADDCRIDTSGDF